MTHHSTYFCVSCNTELSNSEKMYSDGRCPHCGFKHPDSCTIVRTYERSYHYIKPEHEWWNVLGYFSYTKVFDDEEE